MSKIKKIIFYFLLTAVVATGVYFYIWEKPKLEMFVKLNIEKLSKGNDIPFGIKIGKIRVSIIPLQLELNDVQLTPKGDLKKMLQPFAIGDMAIRPSIIDLVVGKFWISQLKVNQSVIALNLDGMKSSDNQESPFADFDGLLSKIPISQLDIQNIQLQANYQNYHVNTESLYVKAYNEKSSLIVTVKDPNIQVKTSKDGESLNILADIQLMMTKNTVSLSKIKLVKESSYFLASGHWIYKKDPSVIQEMLVKTRINSNFESLHKWSNQVYKNNHLGILKGKIKTDINIEKNKPNSDFALSLESELKEFRVEKILLGDIKASARVANKKQIIVKSIDATLSGKNKVLIENVKVDIGKKTDFVADVKLIDTQLQSFLKESTIADIPVWLTINGSTKCTGSYETKLNVHCPGSLNVTNLKIQNAGRTKTIVSAKKFDISGSMNITESEISYKADAKLEKSKGQSDGVISFAKGFNINYNSDHIDFAELSPIADLKFAGVGKAKGSTQGDSRSAVFGIDMEAENFEFEDYFFGVLKTKLNYKNGVMNFEGMDGTIESTRYNGSLQVDLINDKLKGDLNLPFFRMEDVQQSILKKVQLDNRFLGSGSGRLQIDSPFSVSRLSFLLDARLFKGQAFGEDYNEAKITAEAIEGIIIIQQGRLEKEKSVFNIKGTIDTQLKTNLEFVLKDGNLQYSTLVKNYNLPMSGRFDAKGSIAGKLTTPIIQTTAKVDDLIFNKKKYGETNFVFDNSKNKTNLQFTIPNHLDLVVVFPESTTDFVFIDLNAAKFDIAPFIGFAVSEEATRSYRMDISGEMSGKIDTKDFWESEFSSTIKEISIDYKANQIVSTIPTNIELKGNQLFINELSLIGQKQFIKITQPSSSKYSTKLIVNAGMNISFFKIFAPFIEKIDGYSTIRLEMTINRNNFILNGNSYITDGFLQFPGFPHAFEYLTADILFNQNKISINSINGQMAQGKVSGDGEITFKDNKKFDLNINTNLENIKIDFPEGFKTEGRANIRLSGSEPPFLLSGDYTVTSGLIDSNLGGKSSGASTDMLEELLKQEVTAPLLVNIDIKTEKSVEVRNTFVEGYMIGNFKVFDKVTSPRIKGEAHFEDFSVIKIRDAEFEVTNSSFVFEGEHPINPKLSLRAKSRLNGYDIDLFLQGTGSKPVLTLSSQPPLPETQILSLLALGTLPDQLQQNQTPGQAVLQQNPTGSPSNQKGFQIGTSMLGSNPLGKELKERLNVDVQFSSSFDDQNNAAVPKVTVRKKISKKLQVSFSQSTGNVSQSQGRVAYELNKELSTIFFIQDNTNNNVNTLNNTNPRRQSNPFGIDLEYKKEFD